VHWTDCLFVACNQICRVDHIDVLGLVLGSVVHIQRARNVTISPGGVISASALGGFLLYLNVVADVCKLFALQW
jgi:hypothetical protein